MVAAVPTLLEIKICQHQQGELGSDLNANFVTSTICIFTISTTKPTVKINVNCVFTLTTLQA